MGYSTQEGGRRRVPENMRNALQLIASIVARKQEAEKKLLFFGKGANEKARQALETAIEDDERLLREVWKSLVTLALEGK